VAEEAQRKVIAGKRGRKYKRTLSMVQSTSKQREESHTRGEPSAQVEETICIICAETLMKTGYSAVHVKAGHTKNVLE
jgi:hypothetical protein